MDDIVTGQSKPKVEVYLVTADRQNEEGLPITLPVLPRVGDIISNKVSRQGSDEQKLKGSGTHDYEVREVVFECTDRGIVGNEPVFQRINLICVPIKWATSSEEHAEHAVAAKNN